ncbi:MAG: hypothetical protein CBE49_002840 [Rickettsiales bacterium TMED289]|nr:MAG: hypothetical protein CBE49_002840 [Rickettsiales bacterium TMED289]|tara:strand:- start:2794 stop:6486 length:3693 start_codon:yes stop_codon:yes gene_type:complete
MKFQKEILNPELIKIDDRSFSDLINYISELSKEINYYNSNDKLVDSFYGMFSNNESFLISEISKFDIDHYESIRIKKIKEFDKSENLNKKKQILDDYLLLTKDLFDKINEWFNRSIDKKISLDTGNLNYELETLINKHASKLLLKFNDIILIIKKNKIISMNNDLKNSLSYGLKIWKYENDKFQENFKKNIDINSVFKKLILVNNALIKIVNNLIKRCGKKLNISLSKQNHNSHIGLLFSFIKLFKYLQDDINKISKKHLDFYYSRILMQKPKNSLPNKTFAVFSIDQNVSEVLVKKNKYIKAGQYSDGSVINYKVDHDINLNNAKLSFLMTIFLSKSRIYDFNSRYRLISSVFSKIICKNELEIEKFNKNLNSFNALGFDQNFLSDDDVNMDIADLGFIIGSSILKMGVSERELIIDIKFSNNSIRHLSDLIIDIANNTNQNENEIFYKVFSDSFIIDFTSKDGWQNIVDYDIIMPDDWATNKISILIKLEKSIPEFLNYDKDAHGYNIEAKTPLLRFIVNQNSFYNVYAFLEKTQLEEINIKSNVKNLKELQLFRDGQTLQNSGEIDFFGATPKYNSKLFIGCEELFNKNITDFKLKWTYSNLDEVDNDLENYYENYGINFSNELFRLKLSVLSDFNYLSVEDDNFEFSMFETEKGRITDDKSHTIKKLNNENISPNFEINKGYIHNFSNDYETGLIKIELVSPKYAFGHKLYPKVYTANISNNLKDKDSDPSKSFVNEPYSPKISEITIDYFAETSFYFNEKERANNNFDENNSFYHISPYGIKQTFSENEIEKSMFYDLQNEGELILGFNSSERVKSIDLLFEINKNENESYDFSSKIEWYYTTRDGWKKLPNQNILNDQTNNLLNNGVISFLMPNDFKNSNNILNKNDYYLKATSRERADQLGLIKSIFTNSVSASEIIPKNENVRLNQLKSGSFQILEDNIKGIVSLSQPIDSPVISLSENKWEYYKRVSDLLKHKNRPITKSDFERFIINNFNYLSFVKCVNNSNNRLSFVCLKKIESYQNIDEVKLSSSQINEITQFLNKYISTSFDVEIINPIFEDMWIKCSAKFKDINAGRAIDLLNKDILEFICPWKNSLSIEALRTKIKNIDILNFIKNRRYIEYVTGFSVIHFKNDENGNVFIYDSASENYDNDFIEVGGPKSIIIPRNTNQVKVLNSVEYEKPSPINYKDLKIDENLISERNFVLKEKNIKKENEKNYKNLQFIIN